METPAQLADGRRPATAKELLDRLAELGLKTKTVEHPAVFTVEEAKSHRGELPGCHTKNLFLRDKKGVMWLVVCLEDRKVDLKALSEWLGSGRLSFGSAQRLMEYLGVIPGAVTPFAVINDRAGCVRLALDRKVMEHQPLNFHPLNNAMTTSISANDLLTFLEVEEHVPLLIDFSS